MKISTLDGSNYFRGLLILIRMDGRISMPEMELMRRIGKSIGFDRDFVETSIREILENEHISEAPPFFSSTELARKFIKDGFRISASDIEIHPKEEEWLQIISEHNALDYTWFLQEKQNAIYKKEIGQRLEVEDLKM
jgi:hypothetical protein